MIVNFNCRETEKIWKGLISLKLPNEIQHIIRRKLRILSNAKILRDLTIPPNNRLEGLKGKRKSEYSIRVNKQWRICFVWENSHAHDVGLEDYH